MGQTRHLPIDSVYGCQQISSIAGDDGSENGRLPSDSWSQTIADYKPPISLIIIFKEYKRTIELFTETVNYRRSIDRSALLHNKNIIGKKSQISFVVRHGTVFVFLVK